MKSTIWIVAAALLGAAAPTLGGAMPAHAEGAPFTIGTVLDPNINIPLFVARDKELFKKYRVPATVKPFPSGAEIVQAIAGGSLDFGATGGVPATLLAGRGGDVRAVARVADISYELALATTKEAGLKAPSDIKGKTVGQTDGTVSQYLVLAFAKHWGIPLDSFKRVNLGPADQLNALARGSIQLVSIWEPFTSRHRDSGGVILQTALESFWPGAERKVTLVGDPGILFGRNAYLGQNVETVKNLLRAVKEATDWANKNQDEAADIAARALNAPKPAMLALIQRGYIYFNFDQHLADELEEEAAFLKEQNLLPKEFRAADWLEPRYMKEVFPDLVTWRGK